MYCIEGTIGSGKSTFMQLLADNVPHISVALEPMYAWQNDPHGQALLERYYKDPNRWAYTIEMFALSHRVKEHMLEQTRQQPFRVIERSIYSSHFVFARNSYENEYMDQSEWDLCNDWFHSVVPGRCKPPHGFIYLRVPPEVALERVKKRSWHSEQHLTLAYLKKLHDHYEYFFAHKEKLLEKLAHVPVLIIECNAASLAEQTILKNNLEKIEQFFTQTQNYTPAVSIQKPTNITRV